MGKQTKKIRIHEVKTFKEDFGKLDSHEKVGIAWLKHIARIHNTNIRVLRRDFPQLSQNVINCAAYLSEVSISPGTLFTEPQKFEVQRDTKFTEYVQQTKKEPASEFVLEDVHFNNFEKLRKYTNIDSIKENNSVEKIIDEVFVPALLSDEILPEVEEDENVNILVLPELPEEIDFDAFKGLEFSEINF